jgi:putative FmdB family regulatory protein
MPAYEYLCDACETRFDQRQKMSDPVLELCPTCGGRVHRLISGGAGAITKGAGHTHASAHADAPPPCASGGACCGGGACASGMFSEN